MPDRYISRKITGSTYTANGLHHQHEQLKKLINLHVYEATVVHRLHDTELDARLNFMNWYLHVPHEGETYLPHSFCLTALGFILVETRTLRLAGTVCTNTRVNPQRAIT